MEIQILIYRFPLTPADTLYSNRRGGWRPGFLDLPSKVSHITMSSMQSAGGPLLHTLFSAPVTPHRLNP